MRQLVTIVGVCVTAAVAVGIALGGIPGADGTIQGCYLKLGGGLRVIDADRGQRCTRLEAPISWSQQGPQGLQGVQGAAGSFSGTFASPSGQYRLSVTDSGIRLAGPSGSVAIGGAGVAIEGPGAVSINGALIQLNGCSALVARSGDPVTGTADGDIVNGSIVGGSLTVCTG